MMSIKEKIQKQKDIRTVKKSSEGLKYVDNQTQDVIFAAFRKFGPEIVPYIKNLTVELYSKLEKYRDECMEWRESVISQIPEKKLTQEICVESVRQSILLFDEVPEKFRNYEVYLTYASKSSVGLKEVPKEYCTMELYKAAITWNEEALQYIPAESQTVELCKLAFETNERKCRRNFYIRRTSLLQYIHNQTEELCLIGVKQNGMSLRDAQFQNDEICLAAVKENGLALQFVKNQTKEICFEAVDDDRKALMYIKDKDMAQLVALYANIKNEEDRY